MKKVAVLSGDGVGPEVVSATVTAINALTSDLELINADIGYDCFKRTHEALPKSTVDLIDECDAVLLGCVTVPDNDKLYRDPVIEIGKRLDLFANIRPVTRLVPDLGIVDCSAIFIRENTEGLFTLTEVEDLDGASYTQRATYAGCKRICQFARSFTEAHNLEHLTCVHKAEIYKQTDGLFLKTFREVMEGSKIRFDDMKAEDMASTIAASPKNVEVVVSQSLYGDIISEEASALTGGVHLAPSCDIGDRKAMFKPMHASKPDLASLNVVNPTASLLSGAMMLEYLGFKKESDTLRDAIVTAYKRGDRTSDVGGSLGTYEFADKIISLCQKQN